MVSFYTEKTKERSKERLRKGSPAPTNAMHIETRKKQMVLVFFDCRGIIYTRYAPVSYKVDAAYIIDVMSAFLKSLKKKRPELTEKDWIFHWDNAPVHKAKVVKTFLEKKYVKLLDHPLYLPDLAPADFFLFPKIKDKLGGGS